MRSVWNDRKDPADWLHRPGREQITLLEVVTKKKVLLRRPRVFLVLKKTTWKIMYTCHTRSATPAPQKKNTTNQKAGEKDEFHLT
jgi:hypothetical protein